MPAWEQNNKRFCVDLDPSRSRQAAIKNRMEPRTKWQASPEFSPRHTTSAQAWAIMRRPIGLRMSPRGPPVRPGP